MPTVYHVCPIRWHPGIHRGNVQQKENLMSIVTITISIDTGKESPEQRKVRISATENGRKTRTRAIPDKRNKAPKHKKPLTDED